MTRRCPKCKNDQVVEIDRSYLEDDFHGGRRTIRIIDIFCSVCKYKGAPGR